MRSWVPAMWALCLSVAFAETQRSSVVIQYTQDQYCSSSVLRETTACSDLWAQCCSDAQCVAYSCRGSHGVLHDGFCSSSDLLPETGARYAEVEQECFGSSCYTKLECLGSSCYFLPTPRTNQTKASAQANCEKFGAHVLAIETLEENELVANLLTGTPKIWLNLKLNGTSWEQDGEPVTYFNWNLSQPNGDGVCVRLHAASRGQWWDGSCNSRYEVVCEK